MKKISLILSFLVGLTSQLLAQENWVTYLSRGYVEEVAVKNENTWFLSGGGIIVRDSNNKIIKEYTNANGLIANTVNRIMVDSKENVWTGNYSNGVSKFDGTKWEHYTQLSPFLVKALAEDSKGNIWVGTDGGGASKFDGSNWVNYTTSNSELKDDWVRHLASDSSGNIWIGTDGGGLSKFDGTNWITYTNSNSKLLSDYIRSLEIDQNGNVWIGTTVGVSKFDGTTWTTYNSSNSGLVNNVVEAITQDSKGNIWFGTRGGVFKFDGTKWINYNTSNSGLIENDIVGVTEDNIGEFWIITAGGGVMKFNGITYTDLTEQAIYLSGIYAIQEDNNNNVWFGHAEVGVSKFDGINWSFYNPSNCGVLNIKKDNNGNLWFVSCGISKFDGTTWTTYDSSNSGLVDNWVETITVDSKGNMWFGTNNSGVSKFDGTTWTTYDSSNSGLVDNSVLAITQDSKGNMWFGTNNGGVSKFDGTTWTTYNSSNSGLVYNVVTTITQDSKGNMWFGTNRGVSKFDGTTWTTYNSSNSGLVNNWVETITVDSKGNIWVGTHRDGVSKFNGTAWTTYTTSNSDLVDNSVFAITQDSKGNMWFGTNGGVSVLKSAPKEALKITSQATAAQSKCVNAVFSPLSVTVNDTTGVKYQWYRKLIPVNTGGISMTSTGQKASYVPSSAAAGAYYYYCIVSNATSSDTSDISGLIISKASSMRVDSVKACYSFRWNGVTYTNSGTYTKTGLTNSLGCDSTAKLVLTIQKADTAITISGATITAIATSSTYQWIDCNTNLKIANATAKSFTATKNGNYAVIVKSNNNCIDTSRCSQILITDLYENNFAVETSVYPNPTQGQFTISVQNNAEVSVVNILGQEIAHKTISKGETNFSLDTVPAGMYLVRINSGNKQSIHQLVVE